MTWPYRTSFSSRNEKIHRLCANKNIRFFVQTVFILSPSCWVSLIRFLYFFHSLQSRIHAGFPPVALVVLYLNMKGPGEQTGLSSQQRRQRWDEATIAHFAFNQYTLSISHLHPLSSSSSFILITFDPRHISSLSTTPRVYPS